MNDSTNVLAKLIAQVQQELEAAHLGHGQTTDDQQQTLGRIKALGDVRRWILDAQIADTHEQTDFAKRANRLREDCFDLAEVYRKTSNFLDTVIPLATPDVVGLLKMLRGLFRSNYDVLTALTGAATPEEYADAERILDLIRGEHEKIRALAFLPRHSGTVQ